MRTVLLANREKYRDSPNTKTQICAKRLQLEAVPPRVRESEQELIREADQVPAGVRLDNLVKYLETIQQK